MVQLQIAMSYLYQRRFDEVIIWANKALALDPTPLLAIDFLEGAYWMRGDIDRFLAANVAEAQSRGATDAALADHTRSCSEMQPPTALQRAHASPADAVMMGDTPYDIEACVRAGVPIIAFRCGGWTDDDLRGAIAIYDGPWDLLSRLESSLFGTL